MECRFSSACRTSGRCSTSFEGILTGSSCGSCKFESSNFSGRSLSGKPPANTVSRSRCWANCFSSGGNVAAICASCASCAATSSSPAYPLAYCVRKISNIFALILISSLVASICARSEASWMAAAATLELRVILVAARAKRACSCCAFKDSTVRRFKPKTSGTNETLTSGVKRLY